MSMVKSRYAYSEINGFIVFEKNRVRLLSIKQFINCEKIWRCLVV